MCVYPGTAIIQFAGSFSLLSVCLLPSPVLVCLQVFESICLLGTVLLSDISRDIFRDSGIWC